MTWAEEWKVKDMLGWENEFDEIKYGNLMTVSSLIFNLGQEANALKVGII